MMVSKKTGWVCMATACPHRTSSGLCSSNTRLYACSTYIFRYDDSYECEDTDTKCSIHSDICIRCVGHKLYYA